MGTLAAPAPRHRVSLRPHAGFITASALFAAVLVTLLLSAFHAPSPHGLPVGIVAPAALTGHVEQALGSALPGGFDLRLYGGAAAARTAIAHSQLDGALIAGPGGLRLLVAQAAGTAPTQALTNAFGAVAAGAKLPLTVTDVVPPLPGDSQALSPFFVILAALFPSLAAGSASALVFRRARPAWCVAAPVVAMFFSFLAASAVDISGCVRLYVPAAPQHMSLSGSGTNFKPGISVSRARGASVTFWAWARWQAS